MIHGDLFREGHHCPLMNSKLCKDSENPYGHKYIDLFEKFERLKENILEKYFDIVQNIQVMWSCDWTILKNTKLKEFISTLSLPPKYRLVPRDAVPGGRTDTFCTIADSSETRQIFYQDAS